MIMDFKSLFLYNQKQFLDKNGIKQEVIWIEELSELIQAISKMERGQNKRDNLLEELSDSLICLEQLDIRLQVLLGTGLLEKSYNELYIEAANKHRYIKEDKYLDEISWINSIAKLISSLSIFVIDDRRREEKGVYDFNMDNLAFLVWFTKNDNKREGSIITSIYDVFEEIINKYNMTTKEIQDVIDFKHKRNCERNNIKDIK